MKFYSSMKATGARPWIFAATLGLLCLALAQGVSATPNHVFFSVNHNTSATTMVQGDTVGWGATCAVGDSVIWSIWCDLNNNGVIDNPGDVFIASYTGVDGGVTGNNGPPDDSPTPDGKYQTPDMFFGLAPGHYVFQAEYPDHSLAQQILTSTAMPSPPNTFSGTITVPGHPAPDAVLQDIWIEADAQTRGDVMSSALTNANGQFTINIGSVGTDLEFRIRTSEVTGFVQPSDQLKTASGAVTGVDFAYLAAADSLSGQVVDLDDALITLPISVYCSKQNGVNKSVNTNDGNYVVPFGSSELGEWNAGVSTEGLLPTYLAPSNFAFDNTTVHGITHNFVCPKADTVLYVRVKENGGNPAHPYRIQCRYDALGYYTELTTDTGALNISPAHISKHYLSGWSLQLVNWDSLYLIPAGYVLESTPTNLHPGDTAVLNLVSGKMIRDTIKCDAGDGPIVWDSILINLWSAHASYNGSVDNNGVYTIYADTGVYQLNFGATGYLVKPSTPRTIHVTGDTTGGLGYTVNKMTCEVTGTLQNVPLPLSGTVMIMARTGIGANSFNVSANVNNANGNYTLWLCDGSWTLDAPNVPNRIAPSSAQLTIANYPDSAQTADFLYSSIADVQDQNGNLPKTFALLQNHPNPFNPTTQISYDLPTAGHVTLTVYDVLGRVVTVLVDESKSAGRYTATWEGVDSRGQSVASGIYFYRITSGSYTEAKKMILLK